MQAVGRGTRLAVGVAVGALAALRGGVAQERRRRCRSRPAMPASRAWRNTRNSATRTGSRAHPNRLRLRSRVRLSRAVHLRPRPRAFDASRRVQKDWALLSGSRAPLASGTTADRARRPARCHERIGAHGSRVSAVLGRAGKELGTVFQNERERPSRPHRIASSELGGVVTVEDGGQHRTAE